MDKHKQRISDVRDRMARLLDYLCLMVDIQDWHGVAGAAADMLALDRELKVLRELDHDGS